MTLWDEFIPLKYSVNFAENDVHGDQVHIFISKELKNPRTTKMFQQNEETPHTPRMKKRKPRKHAREKLKEQKTVWKKFMESDGHMTMVLSYCGLFLIYGMTDELLGPTLIELSCLVSRKIQSMSWLFFSHDAGLLLGTLIGSFIVSR